MVKGRTQITNPMALGNTRVDSKPTADTSKPSPMQTGSPAEPTAPTLSTAVCETSTFVEVVIVEVMKVVNVVVGDETTEGIVVTTVVDTKEEVKSESSVLLVIAEGAEVVATPDESESDVGILILEAEVVEDCESEPVEDPGRVDECGLVGTKVELSVVVVDHHNSTRFAGQA